MLREHLGAAVRGTRRRIARFSAAEILCAVLLVVVLGYTLAAGAMQLRIQGLSREALAQVKSARLAARSIAAECYATGTPFADQTNPDGLAEGVAAQIEQLAALPGSVQLLQTDDTGYGVIRLSYTEGDICAVYISGDGYYVYHTGRRLYYPTQEVAHAAA